MSLRLYNTMGRKMEEFKPITPGHVGFYGCGPTVYNYAHIGNLRAYVFLDILDKTLQLLGYDIKHVMNITDVGHLTGDGDDGEDKMKKTAEERHQSVLEVAKFYTDAFMADIDALNIRHPDVICKATEHIQEMIDLIKQIEANGHTYMAGGNLYYDISTYDDYGKLANLNLDELKAGAGKRKVVVVDENKRNPGDFVLWFTKSKFEDQAMTWDSPWGRGYPGWHIECSTMAMKYLGEHLDIHCGGIDHIAVHHENEIAQSEAFLGHQWVNYWMHAAFLQLKDGKMSKSKGDFLTLDTLVDKGYKPEYYKYFCLTSHYRTSANFSFDALDAAKNSYESLINKIIEQKNLARENDSVDTEQEKQFIDSFNSFMFNDLKTPQALAVMWDALKSNTLPAKSKLNFLEHVDKIFGLSLTDVINKSESGFVVSPEDEKIIEQRQQARINKDWKTSDELRNLLASHGVGIKDLPDNKYQLFDITKAI